MARAAFVAAVVAGAVVPVSASAGGVPELAGVTTISGSETASMLVSVPKAVRVESNRLFRSADVEVSGAGRVFGFLLQNVERPMVQLGGFMVSACRSAGCASDPRFGPFEFVWAVGVDSVSGPDGVSSEGFPAGDYWLTLVTDGVPVTAELVLDELSGSVSLTPTEPSSATVGTPPMVGEEAAGREPFVSGGQTEVLERSGGFVLLSMFWELHNTVVSRAQSCKYAGDLVKSELYVPPCPGDTFQAVTETLGLPHGLLAMKYGAENVSRPGGAGMGGYVLHAPGEVEASIFLLWIDGPPVRAS